MVSTAPRMVQAHLAKLPGLGQVGQCEGIEDFQALVVRVLEVPNPGIGDQRFAAPGEELVQQRQVRPVVQHIGDQDQVKPVGFGEEVF